MSEHQSSVSHQPQSKAQFKGIKKLEKKESQTSLCVCVCVSPCVCVRVGGSQTCRAIQFRRIKVVVLRGDKRAAGFKPTSNLMHGEFQPRRLAAAPPLTPHLLLTNAATQRPPR